MAERLFVLVPLLELAPGCVDPRTGALVHADARAALEGAAGGTGVFTFTGRPSILVRRIQKRDSVDRSTRPTKGANLTLMSDASAGAAEKQHFHLGDFDGPLDLLLFLIRKSEVNIYDIPIASITEQYLSFLSFAAKVDLDTMTEFHLMAATLLYIKSKMLLPVELSMDDELEDPRKELVEKLIEYQKFRKLSDLMSDREGEVEWIIERTRTPADPALRRRRHLGAGQRVGPPADIQLPAVESVLGEDHRPLRGGQREREDHADRRDPGDSRTSSCSPTSSRRGRSWRSSAPSGRSWSS